MDIILKRDKLQHLNSISHEGKVVAIATDSDGKLWYTVKQDGFEDSYLNTPEDLRTGWEGWQALELPNEADDGSVISKELAEFTYQSNASKFILRSCYRTVDQTAVAPVQLVSAFGYLYVFRQAKNGALLLDRFVLDGINNTLNCKLEVRFKRSRQRYQPSQAMKIRNNGELSNIDSVDYTDANNQFFYEPSTEISCVGTVKNGWFSVVLVPTTENDVFRWHFFCFNPSTQKVELTTLRASTEGLFEIKDYLVFDDNNSSQPRSIPGIIKRSFEIADFSVANSVVACTYNLQQEQTTASGELQLVKTGSRVMLVIPGNKGTAALSFTIAGDGTLAQIDETPDNKLVRNQQKEILLPLNTLEQVKAYATHAPTPKGVVAGFESQINENDDSFSVQVTSPTTADLNDDDVVKIAGSRDYQGLYTATAVDNDHFKITLPKATELGYWEKIEDESTSLIFDGMISGYSKTADGELTIACSNHGLLDGDLVQVKGTGAYNDSFAVKKVDDSHFFIQTNWADGEAVNIRLESFKRRGLVFDGNSYVKIKLNEPETEVTHEFWFKTSQKNTGLFSVSAGNLGATGHDRHLWLQDGNLFTRIHSAEVIGSTGLNLADNQWHHLAHVFGKSIGGQQLYVDGRLVASGSKAQSDFNWQDTIHLGFSNDSSTPYFQGEMSEVRIWEVARSQTEINDNRFLQLNGKERGLIGYWRLGALVGENNNPVFAGKSQIRLDLNEPETEVTHEFWFKTADKNAGLFSVSAGDLGASGHDRHLYLSNGNIYARICNNEVIQSNNLSLADQRWHHVAHVFGASIGGQKLYIDGNLVASGKKAASDFTWQDAVFIGFSNDAASPYFQGKITDLRIWKVTRSQDQIKANMFVEQRSDNKDLLAYWHLGSFADGKVVDFSTGSNDGVVIGSAYVSAMTLERKLRDGSSAIKYSNRELFAVSGRATYQENFEFKINAATPVNPNNVDALNNKLFTFNYWGKANRSSEDIIAIPTTQDDFVDLGNGWFKASCLFTTPDNISLLRSFELSAVKGEWISLDIRKHTMRWVSDSVTEARYNDPISLTTLADKQLQIPAQAKQLSGQEQQERQLIKEKAELEALIAMLKQPPSRAIDDKQNQINLQQRYINDFSKEVDYWNEQKRQARDLRVIFCEHSNYGGAQLSLGIGAHNICATAGWWNDRISSHLAPRELSITLYEHGSFGGSSWTGSGDNSNYGGWNDKTSSVKITTSKGYSNYNDIQSGPTAELADAQKRLSALQAELALLQSDEANRVAKLKAYNDRLMDVVKTLDTLRNSIRQLNATLLSSLQSSQQTAQAMPQLAKDRKGLMTQGALLGFVSAKSRVHAVENCEGNVQLSYFDERGRLAQTLYDACADTRNASFEQWLPNSYRTCLNFDGNHQEMGPNAPIPLYGDWSLEAWFAYPLPKTNEWNTLFRSGGTPNTISGHYALAHYGKQLGVYLFGCSAGDGFWDCGFNMESLSAGWHHICVVGLKDTTLFYIDGKLVGDVKAYALKTVQGQLTLNPNDTNLQKRLNDLKQAKFLVRENLTTMGGYGDQFFGRVSEIRVWNIALNQEEIEINRKTLLSGNEPGLVAYYPLSENSGSEVRDATGNGRNCWNRGNWTFCTAPIGHPGYSVMQFDGKNDFISLPAVNLDFSQGISVEAWVWYESFNSYSRIIDFGNGAGSDNIILCNNGTSNNIGFYIARGNANSQFISGGNLETCQWVHIAATVDNAGNASLYLNGQLTTSGKIALPNNLVRNKSYIGKSNWDHDAYFNGKITQLRIWNKGRTVAEIQANMSRFLCGKEANLVAYYPLDGIFSIDNSNKVLDEVSGNYAVINEAVLATDYNLPLVYDALIASEYSTFTTGQDGKTAMMRRLYCYPTGEGISVSSGKRIENLELNWIGNAQFAPTLLGYIEGAPPAPSENFTLQLSAESVGDYNAATSVELTISEDVSYSWMRSQDVGLGASAEIFAGADAEASAGFAFEVEVAKVRAGFKGNLDFSYQFQNTSNITSSSSLKMTDKLEMRGSYEEGIRFPRLGQRFIPKNIGYALVISALADVFITRLSRSKRMIGYQVMPVENIPPDVNTITFMMNPAYTMNGSLDGMTGTGATTERFFKHVPAMRAQYGSLYPASYYRLQEAYDLKSKIEAADKQRESYFASFNALLVDESSLDSETNRGEEPTAISVKRAEDKPAQTDAEKQQQDEAYGKQLKSQAEDGSKQTKSAQEKKQAEIDSKIKSQETKVHASKSFAQWQKKMENIQIRAGKRNIVNTYVWDADGGLRTEAQSFANTVEHSVGGSFSLNAGLGFEGKFAGGSVAVELTAQATMNLTQTMSKTVQSSRGVELNVDLSGIEYRGITDFRDNPILPGEKVDRYRFMSFYLEGSTNNFNDFFNYVVDPEWLMSNDEEARALRQTKAGRANKAWRVLHRVTYVERPALMNFGLDARQATKGQELKMQKQAKNAASPEKQELKKLQDQVKSLQSDNQQLQSTLDEILATLKATK